MLFVYGRCLVTKGVCLQRLTIIHRIHVLTLFSDLEATDKDLPVAGKGAGFSDESSSSGTAGKCICVGVDVH